MTTKEIKYHDLKGNEVGRNNWRKRRKQPFPRIYANSPEDYDISESPEDQLIALRVDQRITNS